MSLVTNKKMKDRATAVSFVFLLRARERTRSRRKKTKRARSRELRINLGDRQSRQRIVEKKNMRNMAWDRCEPISIRDFFFSSDMCCLLACFLAILYAVYPVSFLALPPTVKSLLLLFLFIFNNIILLFLIFPTLYF